MSQPNISSDEIQCEECQGTGHNLAGALCPECLGTGVARDYRVHKAHCFMVVQPEGEFMGCKYGPDEKCPMRFRRQMTGIQDSAYQVWLRPKIKGSADQYGDWQLYGMYSEPQSAYLGQLEADNLGETFTTKPAKFKVIAEVHL